MRKPFILSRARIIQIIVVFVVLVCGAPAFAQVTHFVGDTGSDSPTCGLLATTPCRSISQAIELAAEDDIIRVGPGRYGDLNRKGVIGEPGEETGSPTCACVLAIEKRVIVMSSNGAAVTMIDGREVVANRTVVISAAGAQFGQAGKGFTVTETAIRNSIGQLSGDGVRINAGAVLVRGNQIIFENREEGSVGRGIHCFRAQPGIVVEGNLVMNWGEGIETTGVPCAINKNQVMHSSVGILAAMGTVTSNVVTGNFVGLNLQGSVQATSNSAYMNVAAGISVSIGFTGIVTKNNMFGNGSPLQASFCGLINSGVAGLNASNNYWGTPAGPGAAGANGVCNAGS